MRCFRLIRPFIFILLLPFRVHSQENMLLQYITTPEVSKADSAAIIAMIGNSQQFEYTNIDTAFAMVDQAMARSRELHFNYGIGNAYIAYSVYATTQGRYAESDSFLEKAFPYCVMASAPPLHTGLLIFWYQTASTQAAYRGKYSKSVGLACAALNLLNQRPDDTTLTGARIKAYNAIGSMMQYLDQTEKAFYYLDKGIALAIAHNDKQNLAQLYVNYGVACTNLEQEQQAMNYLNKAVALSKEGDNTFVLQVAYLALANVYRDLGKQDTAISYLRQAIHVSDKTNPFMAKATPYLLLGQAYFHKEDYRNSIRYGDSALSLAEQLHIPQNITQAHALLADAYGATGQWEKAYHHQFAYTRLLDSIRSTATMANVNQLEIKSRVAEKDIELARQQLVLAQKESSLREKNFWIAGISVGLLLLTALLFTLRRSHRHKQQSLENAKELDHLKAMMDGAEQERQRIATELHDGVVSQLWGLKLNLTTTINKQQENRQLQPADFRQSLEYLDDAMTDLRHTAHNLSPEMALQPGLVNAIHSFCDKMNNQGATDVLFQVYGHPLPTDKDAALSIFRAVQELVQNALKHAEATCVLVQLNCEADLLGITVQDDGRGFNHTGLQQEGGMGLQNVKNRIKTLKGTIEIQSNEQGTSIYMEFKNRDITGNPLLTSEHDY